MTKSELLKALELVEDDEEVFGWWDDQSRPIHNAELGPKHWDSQDSEKRVLLIDCS